MKLLSISIFALCLISCSGYEKNENSSVSSKSQKPSIVEESKLSKFMNKTSVCDIISKDSINKTFSASNEISAEPFEMKSKYNNSVTCTYSWDRADMEKRKKEFLSYTIDQMQGKVKKIPMRQRTLEHNFSIRIENYDRKPEHFMPAKLTEKQLEDQIARASKMANKKLTDEQKKVAGNAANSMMEKLLRKNNENIEVDGVGDAAFWTAVGGGSLSVLSGSINFTISPMIDDTAEQDIENAKRIAQLIIQ